MARRKNSPAWIVIVLALAVFGVLLNRRSTEPKPPLNTGSNVTTSNEETISVKAAEKVLAAVPEQLRSNYFLSYKGIGCCKTLTGKMAVTVVMISDSVSTWDDASVSKLQSALNTYTQDVLAEAKTYNAELSFAYKYYKATLTGDVCSGDYSHDWQDPALKSAGLPELAEMHAYVTEHQNAKEAPVLFAFNKPGRAYAQSGSNEFLVLFSDDDFDSFQHELSHIFGAKDFYYPAEVKTLASSCFKDSVMNSGETADPLTAYLIGWTDTLSDDALGFLKETNTISKEYMEEQRDIESLTGNGTKVFSYGTYTGDMIRGRCHGKGTMQYNNGGWYTGDWSNGSWSGTGSGKYIYDDGSSYEGTFKDGKRDGNGTYTYASGSVYTGSWSEDEKNGTGKMQYPNGGWYEGTWSNGEKTGTATGKEIYDNGSYEGAFLNGKRHGQGTYTWSNGDKYSGQWSNGSRTGYGTYTWANGSSKTGTWQDGKFIG